MLNLWGPVGRGGRLDRRELLRVGGLSLTGLTLPWLLDQASAASKAPTKRGPGFGKAKNCIMFFLEGFSFSKTTMGMIAVVAIQRFYLGYSGGIANVGRYQFSPVNRTYSAITMSQTAQNYGAFVFGDVTSTYVH